LRTTGLSVKLAVARAPAPGTIVYPLPEVVLRETL
jgi:hypothetical protein